MALSDWQLSYNGLTIGTDTDYDLVEITGLIDTPDIATSDLSLLQRHGVRPGDDYLQGRTITLVVEVAAENQTAFTTLLDDFNAAFVPGVAEEIEMRLCIPGVHGGAERLVNAKVRRRSATIDNRFYYKIPTVLVELAASDPRIYDGTETSAVTTLPTTSGGFEFNAGATPVGFTFPLVFLGSTTGGLYLNNEGNFPTDPVFIIEGPVTNPIIESVTASRSLEFDISVADGDFLYVDVSERAVLLNGAASRYHTLVGGSQWFSLQPGLNEIDFRAATETSSTLTVTFRSAWV